MNDLRHTSIALLAVALAVGLATPTLAELGWKEADYVKRFGKAEHSPLAKGEVSFAGPGGGRILVIFANDRSCEEAWLIDRDAGFVPRTLMRQAQAATKGKPVRRVEFKLEHTPAAEIFEARNKRGMLQVDVRNGGIVRVAQCRGVEKCVLFDRLIAIDLATDDLLARAAAQMRREHGR